MPLENPMLFINLPVADLAAATAFYKAIGFSQNLKFSNDKAVMMTIGPRPSHPSLAPEFTPATINLMLLTEPFFEGFLEEGKKMADRKAGTRALLCLSEKSREGVDEVVKKAKEAGGEMGPVKRQEMEGMYGNSFADLDGHIWEIMWMSTEVVAAGAPDAETCDPAT